MTGGALLCGLLCAALCGLGGLLVPRVVARLPQPAPGDDLAEPVPTYAAVAARPGLRWRAAGVAAGSGAVLGAALGWDRALVGLVPLVPVGVALGVVDLHTRRLPRRLVLPATGAVLALVLVDTLVRGDSETLVRSLVGMLLVRSAYWLLWWLHSAGMGFGDVRLSALLGLALAYLGVPEVVVGTWAAFVVFAVPGLVRAVVRRDRGLLRAAYPFGPAMLVGALLGAVLGPHVHG